MKAWRDDFKEVFKALDKMLDLKTIHRYMAGKEGGVKGKDGYVAGVINAIRVMAASGIGPNNQPYRGYSESYKAHLIRKGEAEKAQSPGGAKRWLRGIGNTGAKGGMLARKRFSTEVDDSGRLFIAWTSDGSKEMDAYWKVHQEGNDKCPARPWFHLNTTGTANAVVKVYQLTIKDLVAAFNAKRMRT